jgi:hypothetical protein
MQDQVPPWAAVLLITVVGVMVLISLLYFLAFKVKIFHRINNNDCCWGTSSYCPYLPFAVFFTTITGVGIFIASLECFTFFSDREKAFCVVQQYEEQLLFKLAEVRTLVYLYDDFNNTFDAASSWKCRTHIYKEGDMEKYQRCFEKMQQDRPLFSSHTCWVHEEQRTLFSWRDDKPDNSACKISLSTMWIVFATLILVFIFSGPLELLVDRIERKINPFNSSLYLFSSSNQIPPNQIIYIPNQQINNNTESATETTSLVGNSN